MFSQVLKLLQLFVIYLLNSFSYNEKHPVKDYTPLTWQSFNYGVLRHKGL